MTVIEHPAHVQLVPPSMHSVEVELDRQAHQTDLTSVSTADLAAPMRAPVESEIVLTQRPVKMTALVKYDAACRALAAAKSVDEVKDIRDKAMAMKLYAKQAKNKTLEADAAEIRELAEYRLGEMIEAQGQAGLLNPGTRLKGGGKGAGGSVRNPPADLPTLTEAGINKGLANKARKLWGLPKDIFNAALAERRRQIEATSSRVTPLLGIAKRLQTNEARNAIQQIAMAAMPPTIADRYRLICADMSTTDEIEPESVDHIITDPPYPGNFLPCFEHLARRVQEWLKPGGSLVVMSGQSYLPEVFAELALSGLTYRWTLCCLTNAGENTQIFDRHIIPKWKPLLWYTKGKGDDLPWIGDIIQKDANDKRFHPWGQSEIGMRRIVELATLPGQIVLDPFCGGGTTGVAALGLGRRFIGLDIDEKCIRQTAARLQKMSEEANNQIYELAA
jgi:DNA modification methylase